MPLRVVAVIDVDATGLTSEGDRILELAITVPVLRTPRTLPRVLNPWEVDTFLAALRTDGDRAMVEAMLLGGVRRGEVLGSEIEAAASTEFGGCHPRVPGGR